MGDSPWDLDEKLLNFFTGKEMREKIYNYLVKFNYRFIEQMTPNDAFYIAAEGKQK